jgi:hypothetical protein
MRFFFSGADVPYNINVEYVLARNDFMISYANLPSSKRSDRLMTCSGEETPKTPSGEVMDGDHE